MAKTAVKKKIQKETPAPVKAENQGTLMGDGEVKFQPGKFPIIHKAMMKNRAGVTGCFTHDPTPILELGRIVGAQAYATEQKLKSDPLLEDDFILDVQRLFCVATAKKMAGSFPQTFNRANDFAPAREIKINFPTAFVPVLDTFGCITDEDLGEFHMIGQSYMVMRYHFQAVAPTIYDTPLDPSTQVRIDRENFWPVNLALTRPLESLFDFGRGMINDWARRAPPGNFQMGGNQVLMSVPTLTSGMAGYKALVLALGKPPLITTMLNILEWIEKVQTNHGGVPNAADRAEGHPLGVYFYTWPSDVARYHNTVFQDTILTDLELAMSEHYNMAPLRELKANGSKGQFLRMDGSFSFVSPFSVAGEDLEIGCMIGSGTTHVEVQDNHKIHVTDGTIYEQMISYVRKAKKKE